MECGNTTQAAAINEGMQGELDLEQWQRLKLSCATKEQQESHEVN